MLVGHTWFKKQIESKEISKKVKLNIANNLKEFRVRYQYLLIKYRIWPDSKEEYFPS